MGDPRKIKKKYYSPPHPWERARIEEEKELIKKYAPKNKKEIWKMNSYLKDFQMQAKRLSRYRSSQAEKEKQLLLNRLVSLGLLTPKDNLTSVLTLALENIMDRRLQTIVFKRGLARSVKQARQFIVHEHIQVGNKVITSPSYLVLIKEEPTITFRNGSTLSDTNHPERVVKQAEKKEEKKKAKKSG